MFIGGCQRDWDQLPDQAAPLIVGIDGGYVHAKDQQSRTEGWFEVIVGKSMAEDGASSKCFGFVSRRLFEMLKSQGMQMNQAVTFLSDGGDTVRDLQMYLNPEAEHLLDWFHISMRLRDSRCGGPTAHLLLQVRTRVLNEDWRSTLSRWYRGMDETCDAKAA